MEYVEAVAAVYMLTIAFMLDAENFRSKAVFNIAPVIIAFLLGVDAVNRMGFLS